MRPTHEGDYVREFIEEVVRTGLMLSGLLADLIEGIPDDAYPGETPAEVVLDMLVGTIRPTALAAGESVVLDATALLAACGDRTLEDLRLALELSRRRE